MSIRDPTYGKDTESAEHRNRDDLGSHYKTTLLPVAPSGTTIALLYSIWKLVSHADISFAAGRWGNVIASLSKRLPGTRPFRTVA